MIHVHSDIHVYILVEAILSLLQSGKLNIVDISCGHRVALYSTKKDI
jgi:hypothetical protein